VKTATNMFERSLLNPDECGTFKSLCNGKNVLLLQGPNGPFFRRLGKFFTLRGIKVKKVNFNGGDAFFYMASGAVAYRGGMEGWREWIKAYMADNDIDTIVLFGQCRRYHSVAIDVASKLGRRIFVYEEGYVRPNYITLEENGVNGNSSIPKDKKVYLAMQEAAPHKSYPSRRIFYYSAFYSTVYHLAGFLSRWRYPHYRHHRGFASLSEVYCWLRAGLRKSFFKWKERKLSASLCSLEMRKKFFLIPLQVFNDSQVVYHSRFEGIEQFLDKIISSYSKHANPEHLLVIKHHPMDRGYNDYADVIKRIGAKYNVLDNMIYVHDTYLPRLLKNAKGVVTINSTVGLSALHHNTPVKVLGDAVYNFEGLTFSRGLNEFWKGPDRVNKELYRNFVFYVIRETQAMGSFYGASNNLLKKLSY